MERQLLVTRDGSHTVLCGEDTYHSIHGAARESQHVYIDTGLKKALQDHQGELRIFEMGFGTGLNALLTLLAAADRPITYECVETHPLPPELFQHLNYAQGHALLQHMHTCAWGAPVHITPAFRLIKHPQRLQDYQANEPFHLLYYDAFEPSAQPELWTMTIFEKLRSMLLPGGILVTYCSKGQVRRDMMSAGLPAKRLKGPPGKRHIVRAIKH